MTGAVYCPFCLRDLTVGSVIVSGEYRITPHSVLRGGERVRLTSSENIILHTIAAAKGVPVCISDLAERSGADSDSNVVNVMICRIRNKLPGLPLETVWRSGYRWTDPVEERHLRDAA